MKKIMLYDTTLRDGAQTEGVSFSLNDKIQIARKLDDLGIHFIEAGWPTNVKDKALFKAFEKAPLKQAKISAFGSTHRVDRKAHTDENLKALIEAGSEIVTIFGKSSDLHVKEVLRVDLKTNLEIIRNSVAFLKSHGKKVFYDAEHFFDAYKRNPEYALDTLHAAAEAGADVLVLCDTNGGTLVSEANAIIRETAKTITTEMGIHAHNDCGLAVAVSIGAIENAVLQVQGTFNGIGERCGNADLCSIIAILKTKMGYDCIPDEKISELTDASRFISEISNLKHPDNLPFVGKSAFAHKGGVHINAISKNSRTYEHILPESVGNQRRLLVSELAGKTPILIKARDLKIDLEKNSPETAKILKLLQDMEHKGYEFEAADASFELLVKKALGTYTSFFKLEGFRVIIEKSKDNKVYSEATIKITVNDLKEHTASEGDGPVNALDNALRQALSGFYPTLAKMHLSDFKVRVLDAKDGTAAKVRVLIQSQDETDSWTTVGVSENIIEASWQALVDSVEYKLLKDAGK